MLAKHSNSVNGKCVLLCTIDEKLWSIVALSASLACSSPVLIRCKMLIAIALNKWLMLQSSCRVICS
jgi:hypothetical protein